MRMVDTSINAWSAIVSLSDTKGGGRARYAGMPIKRHGMRYPKTNSRNDMPRSRAIWKIRTLRTAAQLQTLTTNQMSYKPDHYHQTDPPCELKKNVMGRQGSKKGQKPSTPIGEKSDSAACSLRPTPETDAEIKSQYERGNTCLSLTGWAKQLERERDELRDQLRKMVKAKGRFNTQKEMEKLISILPENSHRSHSQAVDSRES